MRSRKVLAAAVVAVLVAGAAAACNTPTVPASGRASGKVPVVFVHGWFEGNTVWGAYINGLKAAGWTSGDITNFGFPSTAAGNASGAQTVATSLAAAVDKAIAHAKANGNPNASKVALVSHSYGSLISRYCMTLGGCAGKVSSWVSLAGADGGTAIASIPALLGQGSGRDMSNNSAVVQQLRTPANIQKVTDQGVKVMSLWSPADGVIMPAQNSQWPTPQSPDPASNYQLPNTVNHLSILADQQVVRLTIEHLSGRPLTPPTTTGPTTQPTTAPTTAAPTTAAPTTVAPTTVAPTTTRPATTTTHGDHQH